MAITKRVQRELVEATPTAAASLGATTRAPTAPRRRRRTEPSESGVTSTPLKLTKAQREAAAERSKGKAWTVEEHRRFLDALELFPAGPWKAIADYVGTKNSRQTMTHAQKCREKHERKTRARPKTVSKKKKKAMYMPPRRQLPRRRASSVVYRTAHAESESENDAYESESMDCEEEVQTTTTQDKSIETSQSIVLDEATFFSGCDETSVGSPPIVSLLSLPDVTLFASDDLWHSASIAEVALGATKMVSDDDQDQDTTDLEDLHDFAVGLSQECW